jgi:hypothetical protein
MKVFIKAYGWCNVLKQDSNYSLIEHNGSKICYNTSGHQFKNNL